LKDGSRGALRVIHLAPFLKEMRILERQEKGSSDDVHSLGEPQSDIKGDEENLLYEPEPRQRAEDDVFYSEKHRQVVSQRREDQEEIPDADWIREHQVYIPESLVPICLNYFHEGLCHPGAKRTLASVMTKYYWSGMTKTVFDHCQKCKHCHRRKADTATRATPTPQHNPIPSRPFQTVHADLITEMPETVGGNTIISVVVDSLTGWLSLSAHAHKDADTISKELTSNVFLRYGIHEVLKTDNGTEFRNGTMSALEHLLKIRASYTCPYHPQANGKAEVRNKTIYDLLVALCKDKEDNHRRWDDFLPAAAWAYNTTVKRSTGYTPFRALFGREARNPSDSWIEEFASSFNVNIHDYMSRKTDSLRHVWDSIVDQTMEQHERVSLAYELQYKRAFTPYRIGEQFYYKMVPRRNFISAEDEKK
jgi:hypothetical protein